MPAIVGLFPGCRGTPLWAYHALASLAQDPAVTTPPPPEPDSIPAAVLGFAELALALAAPVVLAILWKRRVIGPGALRRLGVRAPAFPWWFYLVSAIAIFVAGGFGGGVAFVAFGFQETLWSQAVAELGATITMIAAGAALAVVLSRHPPPPPGEVPPSAAAEGATPSTSSTPPPEPSDPPSPSPSQSLPAAAGLTLSPSHPNALSLRPHPRDLPRSLLAFLAALPVVCASSILTTLLAQLIAGSPPPTVAHETLKTFLEHRGHPATRLMAASAVLAAPVAEELIFRGFLQTSLLALTRRPALAITLTSALFAAIHLGGGVPLDQAYAIVPLFVLSLAMGTAYERTRRLWVPIGMHAAFNALNVATVALM